MPSRRFLLWNALGGIAWAATVGTAAYLLGRSASGSLGAIGFVGVALAALVYLVRRIRERGQADKRREGRPRRHAQSWPS
jgi:membrane-associated protein